MLLFIYPNSYNVVIKFNPDSLLYSAHVSVGRDFVEFSILYFVQCVDSFENVWVNGINIFSRRV